MVHPNPASDEVHFSLSGWQGRYAWSLRDAAGREVRSGEGQALEGKTVRGRIPLDGLPAGVHVLTLSQPGTAIRKKVVVF